VHKVTLDCLKYAISALVKPGLDQLRISAEHAAAAWDRMARIERGEEVTGCASGPAG
jgi:hypothetical protein